MEKTNLYRREVEKMKKKQAPEVHERIQPAQLQSELSDPQGSYTGVPADPWEVPVQDQDDL